MLSGGQAAGLAAKLLRMGLYWKEPAWLHELKSAAYAEASMAAMHESYEFR